jgi:hypothetical protein
LRHVLPEYPCLPEEKAAKIAPFLPASMNVPSFLRGTAGGGTAA